MTKKTPRQMHVFKVVSRVKVPGERRSPYRVLGVPHDADLYALAAGIVGAFDFDFDHAFGFFDGKDPYCSGVKYELFHDADVQPMLGEAAAPSEAQVAISLLLEVVDRRKVMADTTTFLTRRLGEELLPLVPERLRAEVEAELNIVAADLLDLDDIETDGLPPGFREALTQPGGLEQMLQLYGAASAAGDTDAPVERGVKGVPVTEPFGRTPTWTFLFDYGDDWMFDVTYQGLQDAPPRVRLPRVLDSLGTAPEQYPDWDE